MAFGKHHKNNKMAKIPTAGEQVVIQPVIQPVVQQVAVPAQQPAMVLAKAPVAQPHVQLVAQPQAVKVQAAQLSSTQAPVAIPAVPAMPAQMVVPAKPAEKKPVAIYAAPPAGVVSASMKKPSMSTDTFSSGHFVPRGLKTNGLKRGASGLAVNAKSTALDIKAGAKATEKKTAQ
ncbi:hypothetical protein GNI_101410, partial [Gregarina niphandrodes]